MSVLVISPHPDDEAIGCGGAICLHAQRGERVTVAFLTSGELGLKQLPPEEAWHVREEEAKQSGRVLGAASLAFLRGPDWSLGNAIADVADRLAVLLASERPDLVYVPHRGEWHPDHQAALPVLLAALSSAAIPEPAIRTYEVWTPMATYGEVVDITSVIRRKLRAVRCYPSQLAGFRYDRAAHGLAQFRGALMARSRFAEVFGYPHMGADV
jgi:N-acetylglucosamine malate deacetylase 1